MNILRDLQYELPADFDLSAQVPRNTIMGAIIGIVAILAMAIILTVYIRKRQKGGIELFIFALFEKESCV